MPFSKRGAVVAARALLLVLLAASESFAQFSIRNGFLAADGDRFIVRGAAYSSQPIGFGRGDVAAGAGCRYARDLPLLAAAGANTIRTLMRIEPTDDEFAAALEAADLYWLADFPLDADAAADLGASLTDFLTYAEAWKDEPRLIGFALRAAGEAIPPGSLLSFAAEARRRLREAGSEKLLTVAASGSSLVSPSFDGLDFWSLDLTGRATVSDEILRATARTSKPVLVISYGVDAYDSNRGVEMSNRQTRVAEKLAREVESLSQSSTPAVLGGLWAALLDEWWRGGPDPIVHGTQGSPSHDLLDGRLNPAWLGLFRSVRSGTLGFDSLRPRGSYFALARAWGASPPAEITLSGSPSVFTDESGALGGGFAFTAPGALTSLRGNRLTLSTRQSASPARLPPSLGTVSLCAGGRHAGLLYVDETEIRARMPEDIDLGFVPVIAYRGGLAGAPAEIDIRAAAPTIFPGAVLRPGRPCPLLGANAGVWPGDALEIYGTGLSDSLEPPVVLLDGVELDGLYSGPVVGVAGAYQTNVRLPADTPSGPAELRLRQGDSVSNRHDLAVLFPWDKEGHSTLRGRAFRCDRPVGRGGSVVALAPGRLQRFL